jgi:hypothetical protein
VSVNGDVNRNRGGVGEGVSKDRESGDGRGRIGSSVEGLD